MAWASLKMNETGRGLAYLAATAALGLAFLVIKLLLEYIPKFHHELYPATSTFYAVYYTMTGLHALHIVGGVLVMLFLLATSGSMLKSAREQFVNRVENTGLYWHFVDLVWIFLFPVFYLL